MMLGPGMNDRLSCEWFEGGMLDGYALAGGGSHQETTQSEDELELSTSRMARSSFLSTAFWRSVRDCRLDRTDCELLDNFPTVSNSEISWSRDRFANCDTGGMLVDVLPNPRDTGSGLGGTVGYYYHNVA